MSLELEIFVLIQVVFKVINIGPSLDKAGRILSIRRTADYLETEDMLT